MALLDKYEEKWARKVSGAKSKWISAVKSPDALDAYVKTMSLVTGYTEATVRNSRAGVGYSNFQKDAEDYAEIWEEKIKAAAKANKWSKNFAKAFSEPPE